MDVVVKTYWSSWLFTCSFSRRWTMVLIIKDLFQECGISHVFYWITSRLSFEIVKIGLKLELLYSSKVPKWLSIVHLTVSVGAGHVHRLSNLVYTEPNEPWVLLPFWGVRYPNRHLGTRVDSFNDKRNIKVKIDSIRSILPVRRSLLRTGLDVAYDYCFVRVYLLLSRLENGTECKKKSV